MKTLLLVLLALSLVVTTSHAQNPMTLVGQYDGEAAEDYFGLGMTTGDFNDDGFDEFIIGAYGWNNYTGKNYIYPGGPVYPNQPSMTIQGQEEYEAYDISVQNVGDTNGDLIPDFTIGAHTYGTSVDTAKIDVYFGLSDLDTIADWTFFSPYYNTGQSWVADSCGDVNGDSANDFVVLHHAYEQPGTLNIFWGGENLDEIPDWTCNAGAAWKVFGLGDVNGDGYGDIMTIVAGGQVLLYLGSADMDTIPDLVFNDGYCYYGVGAGVRDFNGDGYNDIALMWKFPDSTLAQDVVHFGGPDMDTIPDLYLKKWDGTYSRSNAFSSGDFNGDGYGDIVSTTGYAYYVMGVQIHLGGPNCNPTPDAYVTGYAMDEFGNYLDTGDINGDGHDELLVTALNYPWFHQGRVLLYEGPDTWIDYGVGAANEDPSGGTPKEFRLWQNYPNPLNSCTSIRFAIDKPSPVYLAIYNLQGGLVTTLLDKLQIDAGQYAISWTGRNCRGELVPSGVYVIELRTDQKRQSIKSVLLR